MDDIVVDFLLESLKEILSCTHDFVLEGKDAIKSLYDDLKSITTFLKNPHILTLNHQEMVEHFQQTACAMLDLNRLFWNHRHWQKEIKSSFATLPILAQKKESRLSSIKKTLMDDIDNNTKLDGLQLGSGTPPPYASGYQIEGGSSVYDDEDIFVGFEQEEATVKDRLVGELKKL
ncbi:hypothetical protein L6452_15993 [Arctium lappa]|uniref:Uncharacterized protein n=1 Tax=Arctium lappa TaxID=4217 RepID=A0ACB9CQV6_ARCLA|nr:hypothetical protein L6452_15993 [Arctium lappa]